MYRRKVDPKYKIIRQSKIEDLEYQVNIAIEDGWIPSGGISTVLGRSENGSYQFTQYSPSGTGTNYSTFIQAMVYNRFT